MTGAEGSGTFLQLGQDLRTCTIILIGTGVAILFFCSVALKKAFSSYWIEIYTPVYVSRSDCPCSGSIGHCKWIDYFAGLNTPCFATLELGGKLSLENLRKDLVQGTYALHAHLTLYVSFQNYLQGIEVNAIWCIFYLQVSFDFFLCRVRSARFV